MNSFRVGRAGDRVRDRAPGRGARRRRAAAKETRGWDDGRGATYHMRSKETSDDYRYFPEPDLPPLRVDAAWLAEIRAPLPELPAARRARYEAPRPVRLRRRGPRRRSRTRRRVRGDPARPDRRSGQGGRELGHRASTCACEERGYDGPASRASRPAELAALSSRSSTAAIRARRAKRSSSATLATASRRPTISRRAGSARSPTTRRSRAPSTRSSPRTPRPWRTTGRASQSLGFLVGQVMKATAGAADAARVTQRCASASTREGTELGLAQPRCSIAGVALIVVGYRPGPGPYERYLALKDQDANIARYEAWRGGVAQRRTTGASVAMQSSAARPRSAPGSRSRASCSSSSRSSSASVGGRLAAAASARARASRASSP